MGGKDGKHIFGTVKVGEKGQIVIPKDARKVFDIHPGDSLLVLGDEAQGLAMVKVDAFRELAEAVLGKMKFGKKGSADAAETDGSTGENDGKEA